jgi:glycine/D-amino acid oxidase-like deaminating enzyme
MFSSLENKWGQSPWRWSFPCRRAKLPASADFVVIGGGFSGLSAAAWLTRMAPGKKVVLLEADRIGAGASGRTGGMALAESAGGDLRGLGDVLEGFAEILRELKIPCDFLRHGAWEVGRKKGRKDSEISWSDSGELRVVNEVPGGTVDAGKLLRGLARAVICGKVTILEGHAVSALEHGNKIGVVAGKKKVLAGAVLIASNAQSLELGGLQNRAVPKLTMAVATEALSERVVETIGMASRRPFYTVDLPYLWGRLTRDNRAIFGSGLVTVRNWRELHALNVTEGYCAPRCATWILRTPGADQFY